MLNNFKNSLIGFVLGDVLGVPVEFEERDILRSSPVIGLREFGTHYQPIGSFSDDTSLTLCTIESIVNNYDMVQTMDLFMKWHEEDYMTSHGITFDSGVATSEAIKNYLDGLPIDKWGLDGFHKNGNGSLMRMLPIAFLNLNLDYISRYRNVYECSSLTHKHNISIMCCFYYTELIKLFLEGNNLAEAYKILQNSFEYNLTKYGFDTSHINVLDRILNDNIGELKESDIESSGYVVHTLEASLWSLINSNNYIEATLKAVNLGNDTDTNGAVTGSMAGLIFGLDNVPKDWISSIGRIDEVVKMADKFVQRIQI